MVFREPGTVGTSAAAAADERVTAAERYGRENPLKFATASTIGLAGAAAGGASAARSAGAAGGLKAALKAEVDPRIGAFGTTAETKLTRRIRNAVDDFQNDQRGQANLIGRLDADSETDGDVDVDAGEVDTDGELGPDIDPFDRSDARLYDPSREFGDQESITNDVSQSVRTGESDRDIESGVSGSGDPEAAPGVDLPEGGFSERGFGDIDTTPDGDVDVDVNDIPALRDSVDAADVVATTVGAGTAARATGVASSSVDVDTANAAGVDTDPDTLGDLDTGIDTRVDVDQGLDVGSDLESNLDRGFDIDRDVDTNDPDAGDFDFGDSDTRDRDRDPTDRDPTPRDPDAEFGLDRVEEDEPLEQIVTVDEERFDTGFFTGESSNGGDGALDGLDDFL
jgi:hypothetical protein